MTNILKLLLFYAGGDSAWGSINTAISFPAHWGVGVGGMARGVGVPVPPPGDLLATISMFEQQIKAEPMRQVPIIINYLSMNLVISGQPNVFFKA